MERNTVRDLVLEAIKQGARKPSHVAKKLAGKANRSYIYSIFAHFRKNGMIIKTPDGYYVKGELPLDKPRMETKAKRKYTRTAPTKEESMVTLGREILKGRQALSRLVDENNRLRNVVQEKDNTITALKIDMLDQQAVINYLEKKLLK